MKIGVPREIKVHEYRVGLVPGSVRELVHSGHEVLIETGAGLGIGCPDDEYRAAGAQILPTAASVFAAVVMVLGGNFSGGVSGVRGLRRRFSGGGQRFRFGATTGRNQGSGGDGEEQADSGNGHGQLREVRAIARHKR